MNSRILKKLCKRVAEKSLLTNEFEIFTNDGADPIQRSGFDRKSYERWKGIVNKYNYIMPLKNTISFGGTYGYYEPEFESEPAYFKLLSDYIVRNTDYDEFEMIYTGIKNITPIKLFKFYGI